MKLLTYALLALAIPVVMQAQDVDFDDDDDDLQYMGLLIDDAAYSALPAKPRLMTRDYTAIPEAHSPRQYAPTPRQQGRYGTCASWSTTYAALTIAEAVARGWTDPEVIDSEAFAPIFVYKQIKESDAPGCRSGTFVHKAMKLLKEKGAPKWRDFESFCADSIPDSLFSKAHENLLDDFFPVFQSTTSNASKIAYTKKSLSQDRPVVICMQVPKSFSRSRGVEVWDKTEPDVSGGWHGMCVVGYDDNKYGGAFEIMNSWGTTWGKGGFIWVRYDDFADHTAHAYETYVAPKAAPAPDEEPANLFSGSLRFHLSTGEDMRPKREAGRYVMDEGYMSGTRYRIYLSNNEPAWVYVLGSDATGEVSMVFPPDSVTSPALLYSSNNIALPDENWFIEMDDTRGTDNICVLYSVRELPINDILAKIDRAKGTFRQRVNAALGPLTVGMSEIVWNASDITFSGKSTAAVIPVFVDITHL